METYNGSTRLPFDLSQPTSFFDDFCAIKNKALDFLYETLKVSPNRFLDVDINLVYLNKNVNRLEFDSAGIYVGFSEGNSMTIESLGNEQIIQIAASVAKEF